MIPIVLETPHAGIVGLVGGGGGILGEVPAAVCGSVVHDRIPDYIQPARVCRIAEAECVTHLVAPDALKLGAVEVLAGVEHDDIHRICGGPEVAAHVVDAWVSLKERLGPGTVIDQRSSASAYGRTFIDDVDA